MLRGSVPSVTSGAQHTFSRAPQAGIPRSSFNRSFGVKTTFNEGYLVPILADEMLPGDTFALKMHAFARISTLLFPIMDNLYMETFFSLFPIGCFGTIGRISVKFLQVLMILLITLSPNRLGLLLLVMPKAP